MNATLHTIVRPDVLAMQRYAVADATGLIKLDAMENPFPLPAALAAELGERLAGVALNRYPAPRPAAVLDKLRARMGVPAHADVLLGNGSDELISIVSVALSKPGAVALAPVPSFVMYEISARLAHLDFVGVPLRDDFSLDADAICAAIDTHRPALVYLPYPNNPTGNLFDDAQIERVLRAARGALVVIDEAYQPFAQRSWMSRVGEFDNLVVMRTVSKLGLAGIRLGYLAGPPDWVAELDKVRPPYNVNVLTQATADFMLDHLDVLDAQAATLRDAREALVDALASIPDVRVFPSAANFVLVRVPDASHAFETLLGRGVLVKNVSKMHAQLSNCLRLTVGTPDENAQMLAAMAAALKA
ncbi:histidinol-phosphate transaminase [Pararobbsia silviterrae]|uniref:Histidinol-phosphate aminotransferase n=1 Tax=Pararobbsia silviterrae TaxID=1792498 RepID=A0A494X4U6_9BURK|nr:histidinol-phosphate transaminase [Pararobbsia silviterrae]RKP45737.1 histidinol-phosphate transaminase [Pararobbsia silviterrae]